MSFDNDMVGEVDSMTTTYIKSVAKRVSLTSLEAGACFQLTMAGAKIILSNYKSLKHQAASTEGVTF